MARPKTYDDRIKLGYRIPADLHERLMVAATERDVSANYLITKALEDFLSRLIPASELRLTK